LTLIKGPCTSEGRELKTSLPQVLQSKCHDCSDKQKRNSRKIILHLQEKKPAEWETLEKKFDPEGKYREEFRKSVQQ